MTRPPWIAPSRVRTRVSAWTVLVLLFVLSLPAVTPRLYAADEIEYFAFLRSLWFDRDLSFDNEYRYFYDHGIARGAGFHETFLELSSATGLRLNFGTIGSAILWAPFYGVADLGVRIARAAGSSVERDGYSQPYLSAVTYASAFYGFLSVLLSVVVARRIVGAGHLAALAVWVGTPLFFYMYLAPGMSHAPSAFAVAAFVALWLVVRERWSPRGLAALGAVAALMTMVREQDAFFAIGPAVDFLWTLTRDMARGRRDLALARARALAVGLVVAGLSIVPQLWAYLVLNGRFGPDATVSGKMRWYAPHAWQVLFSTEHGFLFWTPLALACVLGLIVLARRSRADGHADSRRIAVCLLAMFAAQVYIAGSVDTWTVAGAFGQRRFVGTTVLLVVGLAALLRDAVRWRRTVVAGFVALSIWWNVALAVQFGAGLMDRQRLQLGANAYNAFVAVPLSLPRLAYRFFFDRASFYGSTPTSREPQ